MEFDLSHYGPRQRYKLLSALVIPRPIAWVTTLHENGLVNAAPFSFFNIVSEDPALAVIGLQHPRWREDKGHDPKHSANRRVRYQYRHRSGSRQDGGDRGPSIPRMRVRPTFWAWRSRRARIFVRPGWQLLRPLWNAVSTRRKRWVWNVRSCTARSTVCTPVTGWWMTPRCMSIGRTAIRSVGFSPIATPSSTMS